MQLNADAGDLNQNKSNDIGEKETRHIVLIGSNGPAENIESGEEKDANAMDCSNSLAGNSKDSDVGDKPQKRDKLDVQHPKVSTQDSMDIDSEATKSKSEKTEKRRHVPKNITFGRGAHRGFSRSKYKF